MTTPDASTRRDRRLARKPLGPGTYLWRNSGKTIPLIAVIVLAVLLISGIVSLMDSIPLSIRTIYSYSRYYIGVTPRGDPTLTPVFRKQILSKSPVPIDRVMYCRASLREVTSIVGAFQFVALALGPSDMRYYLDRMGVSRIDGRLPEGDQPEAIISEPVARNLKLHIGQDVLGPNDQDSYSPKHVKIVGIAHTKEWIILAPIAYYRENHFPPVDILLAFAKNLPDEEKLDKWSMDFFKGQHAQVFSYTDLNEKTETQFKTLYTILNVVIGTLVLVITIMMAMLMNIYQSQRIQEFGLLQALGYTRSHMVRRVIVESAIVIVGGWAIGLVVSIALLEIVRRTLMYPRAFSLDSIDSSAWLYTIPAPMAILAAAMLTIILRFRRFDPVGVVERRLV